MAMGISGSVGVGSSADLDGAFDGAVGFDCGDVDFGFGMEGHPHCGDLGHTPEGATTHAALVISHLTSAHDCNHESGFADISTEGHGFHGNVDLSLTGGDQAEDLSNTRRDFGFVVMGHGQADISALIKTITEKLGLLERAAELGSERKLHVREDGILPVRGKVRQMPASYVEGSDGMTFVWRSFYTLSEKDPLAWLTGKLPAVDRTVKTRVRVSVLQWYFAATADYETRVVVSVDTPKSVYNRATRSYCVRASEVTPHRKAARELAQALADALRDCVPSDYSRLMRARLTADAPAVAA